MSAPTNLWYTESDLIQIANAKIRSVEEANAIQIVIFSRQIRCEKAHVPSFVGSMQLTRLPKITARS
jgi:hypothetical protein